MEFRILGPLEVRSGGRALQIGGGKQRALLADLLLHHDEVVTTERLIDDLWGSSPPANATKTVQIHISRLRRALDAGARDEPEGERIATRTGGYVIRVGPGELDLLRFERLLGEAGEARRAGAPEHAAERLTEGLALWRGPPLAELASHDFARAELARLEELRLVAVQERIELALEMGGHAEQVAELEALIAEHPYRERLRELSMLALYRSGRQADALAQYADARRVLTEDLGIEPGEGLRAIHAAVLRQDASLAAPPAPVAVAPEVAAPVTDPFPPARPAPAPAQAGELAPTTVLFTDVEGSVALQRLHGDTEATGILGASETLVRRLVDGHRGRVVKALGDGLMASFDSPRRAVGCGLEIQRQVAAGNARNPELAVRVRVGVHTGELVAVEDDLHGAAVSAAARICSAAAAGDVLVSDVVRQLCSGAPELAFEDRGEHALKGFGDHWRLFGAAARGTSAEVGPPLREPATPFVGRTDARPELSGRLTGAVRGAGSLVLLAGEPGVGKSRLAEEVAEEARQRGFGVITGHCYEARGDLPYMPWVEMLEARTRDLDPDTLRERLGEHAPALAQIAPELRRTLPEIPALLEMPAEQQRRYLFNSVRDYMSGIAEGWPQLLTIEDLHWADESTLLLLEHVADWVGEAPILVLGTYRDTGRSLSPELSDTLARLTACDQVLLLELQRHSKSEVGLMLAGLTGHRTPPAVAAAVFAQSGGNALFVQEAGRWLAESGRMLDSGNGLREELRAGDLEVPASLRLVIDQRLRRMREATRHALGLAAVIGRRFDFETLEAVAGLEPEALMGAVEEAEQERVIDEDPGAAGTGYAFVHELFRQALLAGLSAPRRQRHHLAIADALERAEGLELELRARDIARHLLAAGSAADPERTAGHLGLAGARAQEAAAYEEALRHHDQALELLPDGAEQRASLLVGRGLAQRSLGRWQDASASWDLALSDLELAGRGEEVAALCWQLSQQLLWGYRFEEMARVAARGLAAVGDRPSAPRSRLLAMSGLALCLGGRVAEADRMLGEAMEFAERDGDPALVGEIGLSLTVRRYFYLELPQAEAAGRSATAALRATGGVWNLADALVFLDAAITFQGRFDEASAVRAEMLPLAQRLGHWGAHSVVHRAEGATLAARGDLEALDELARNALDAAEQTGNAGLVAYARTSSAVAALWRGEWARARKLALEGARGAGPFWRGPQSGVLLLVLAMRGEDEAVHARLDGIAGDLPSPGRPNLIGAWGLVSLAGEALALLGERERAAELYPLVAEGLATGAIMRQLDFRLMEGVAGAAAAAAGLRDEAGAHFERALELADRLPHELERPQARQGYARFLRARGGAGDHERAAELLAEAVRGYATLGMTRHRESATADLAALDRVT